MVAALLADLSHDSYTYVSARPGYKMGMGGPKP